MACRVLWVVKGLGPGGAERLLCAQAGVHARERFEIECAYVLPWKDHLAAELERAGVATTCVSRRRRDWWWSVRLWRMVRLGRYDAVHVHSPLPGSVARIAVRSMWRVDRPTVVATEHNTWATHRLPTRWLNRLTSRWNDDTFAVTAEVAESLGGAAARRAEVLRHGIDVARVAAVRADRAEVRAELGIGEDEIVVGTVANFRAQKDYPNLLRAARLLADRGVAMRVVAVGQGPDERMVRRLHDELGLGDRVILTGFRDDAVRVMGACDAFTMASQWEGLPVALMEALALGLPIVATEVGGLAEELVDGREALLVPPRDHEALADALERVVTDDGLRDRLSVAAAARAADFDVSRATRRIEHAYRCDRDERGRAPTVTRDERGRAPTVTGVEIRPATVDDRAEVLALCRASLGWGDDSRFDELFAWKHDHNAFGRSYMWVAELDGRIVGLRAFMRWEFVRGGEVLRAVRAVDTATHPDVQGRGLFTAMTMHALDAVRDDGVDFVFNTPNSKSRPGYLKMGWKEIGRLPVAVRPIGVGGAAAVARARAAAGHWPVPTEVGVPIDQVAGAYDTAAARPVDDPRRLVTNRSAAFARWRFGWELLGYRAMVHEAGHVVVRLRERGAARELVVLGAVGLDDREVDRVVARVAREVGATHALRLGRAAAGRGWLPVPNLGPVMTWREVQPGAMPPLPNWSLTMADVELL